MLKIEDMHVYYGAIHAVKGVSFEVGETPASSFWWRIRER